jgi:aldehyde dehydrogenase (NAD+)
MHYQQQLQPMRDYFNSGATRSYDFRKQQLQKLKQAILQHQDAIAEALYHDLHKSPEETWVTETGFLLNEIKYAIDHLYKWMLPQRTATNLLNLPSKSYIVAEPLGVVLIIGPWNYPLQLLLTPLVGAIAAGNCAVLKASEFAPATAAIMQQIIQQTFPPHYILFTNGEGSEVVPLLMHRFTFDHVFYTGSTAIGKQVYTMAAEKLTPVTLELGGKSPCVVTEDADITVAARRIAMAKFSNCGQMCVAPDYVLVHASQKQALVQAIIQAIERFFEGNPQQSAEYGRIINYKQWSRLVSYLGEGTVLYGGTYDEQCLYIAPTLLTDVSLQSPVMHQEIFGPILPVIAYQTTAQALSIIQQNPNPLAFYVFTASAKTADAWLQQVPSGGACVNNAALHVTNHHLPFGGRGFSGTGKYHGVYSFQTFSHQKALLRTPTWFDPLFKYPPFGGKLKLFKKFIG